MANGDFDQQLTSLIDWWRLAGVEASVLEQPADWFATRPQPTPPAATAGIMVPGLPNATAATVIGAFPDRLDAFHDWLENSADIAEASWIGPRVLPAGPPAPRLMVVLDMPDADDRAAPPDYLAGEAGQLLDAMLRAIGHRRDEIYLCALAVKRPPGGLLPAETRSALTERMRHHIALVAPQSLLLLGDGTSRALLSTDAPSPSGTLHSINHPGGKLPGVATFHPRLMLNQPSAKAECWRALQQLAGVWG